MLICNKKKLNLSLWYDVFLQLFEENILTFVKTVITFFML